MTLQDIESLSVIAASWAGIIFTLVSLLGKNKGSPEKSTANSQGYSKSDVTDLIRLLWKYAFASCLFGVAIYSNVANGELVEKIDILVISGCTGAIILLLGRMMYFYTMWSAIRFLKKDSIAY
tara:strand:- start:128 stop:496 length:369 start_codon:yes stop_codon:yes gene_type:complete